MTLPTQVDSERTVVKYVIAQEAMICVFGTLEIVLVGVKKVGGEQTVKVRIV